MKKTTLGRVFDRTMLLYLVLGIVNYGVCNAIMLIVHHVLHVDRTPSLLLEFFLQTGISFLLNRYVTFHGIEISRWWPLKFVVSVGLSYLVAKVLLLHVFEFLIIRRPLCTLALWLHRTVVPDSDYAKFLDSLVMLGTTFIYCVVNYVGQRYYVFRPRKQDTECPMPPACRTDGGSVPDPASDPGST